MQTLNICFFECCPADGLTFNYRQIMVSKWGGLTLVLFPPIGVMLDRPFPERVP